MGVILPSYCCCVVAERKSFRFRLRSVRFGWCGRTDGRAGGEGDHSVRRCFSLPDRVNDHGIIFKNSLITAVKRRLLYTTPISGDDKLCGRMNITMYVYALDDRFDLTGVHSSVYFFLRHAGAPFRYSIFSVVLDL